MRMTPAKTDRACMFLPKACSGDMYCGVPSAISYGALRRVFDVSDAEVSNGNLLPFFAQMMLLGLMSRWITPFPCVVSAIASWR